MNVTSIAGFPYEWAATAAFGRGAARGCLWIWGGQLGVVNVFAVRPLQSEKVPEFLADKGTWLRCGGKLRQWEALEVFSHCNLPSTP